jgi:hypothetical protein
MGAAIGSIGHRGAARGDVARSALPHQRNEDDDRDRHAE